MILLIVSPIFVAGGMFGRMIVIATFVILDINDDDIATFFDDSDIGKK